MNKIRFATAILDFSKRRGGAEKYLVDLCTRMVRDGHEVHKRYLNRYAHTTWIVIERRGKG